MGGGRGPTKQPSIEKEEVKLSPFVHDMILHTENPKEPRKNLLEQIHKLSKVAGYEINKPSQSYFHTLAINIPKMKLRKFFHLYCIKGIKHLINSTKVRDLYT